MKIPERCPHCGGKDLLIQVLAWAIYRDGKFYTFEVGEEVDDSEAADAVCQSCDKEISLE